MRFQIILTLLTLISFSGLGQADTILQYLQGQSRPYINQPDPIRYAEASKRWPGVENQFALYDWYIYHIRFKSHIDTALLQLEQTYEVFLDHNETDLARLTWSLRFIYKLNHGSYTSLDSVYADLAAHHDEALKKGWEDKALEFQFLKGYRRFVEKDYGAGMELMLHAYDEIQHQGWSSPVIAVVLHQFIANSFYKFGDVENCIHYHQVGQRFPITGDFNMAIGSRGLFNNNTGTRNLAIGDSTLFTNTTGTFNLAIEKDALKLNTSNNNLAIGHDALASNSGGTRNLAIGPSALVYSTTGNDNTSVGYLSMKSNTVGYNNSALGVNALKSNTTGQENVALGYDAMSNTALSKYCTAVGVGTLFNINLENSTGLGYGANASANNQIRIGNPSVNSIGGQVGWSNFSDGRIKKDLRHDVPGLSFIAQLEPVTYTIDIDKQQQLLYERVDDNQWSGKDDIKAMRMSGFVAQDVETAAQTIGYDFSGIDAPQSENGLYGLRYAEFVVPLVKSVQELSKQNATLLSTVEILTQQYQQLKIDMDNLKASVKSDE